jgi:hypothetical protein
MSDNWKYIIWSDMQSFMFFPTSGCIDVWRMPKEAYSPECLVTTVKHGGRSVMVLVAISWYSVCPIITHCQWLHGASYGPMFFPKNDAVFQDNISPMHTAMSVRSWCDKHKDALQHLPWPPESPDLNIIKSLKSVLEWEADYLLNNVRGYSTRDYSELIWV